MSEESPRHLPPEALEDWLAKVSELLGVDEAVDVPAVLDLTRDVARDVARPAAPLTTFVLGLALGGGENGDFEARFRDLSGKVTGLAADQTGQ